ncbi:hematopoietic cell signal transducer isoform X3 [Amia ocellicauda]
MVNQMILLFLALLPCVAETAQAQGHTDCGNCYKIEPGAMVGIIIGDVILTVLIVISVYYCASRKRQKREQADKVYMNVRANVKA